MQGNHRGVVQLHLFHLARSKLFSIPYLTKADANPARQVPGTEASFGKLVWSVRRGNVPTQNVGMLFRKKLTKWSAVNITAKSGDARSNSSGNSAV